MSAGASEGRVRLLFLGRLQDLAGGAEREVALQAGATLGSLIKALEPGLAAELLSPRVRTAINGAVGGDPARPLAANDEIAFLPPVSGG